MSLNPTVVPEVHLLIISCLQSKEEMVEVAGYIVVCWLEIIGFAHTKSKNRACQAAPDLPCNMKS